MPQFDLMTAHQRMAAYLERHNVEQPRLASEILVSKTLGIRRMDIYTRFDRPVTELELDAIRIRGKRLAGGEPLQLIVGDAQFLSYLFKVARGVFIPRPETEILVDIAAQFLKSLPQQESPTGFLDLCAGTGVVSLSLLKLTPNAIGIATDISENAVALALENARLLGVNERYNCTLGDLFETLDTEMRFDAVISNPPYIPASDIESLPEIVKNYDPRAALDGGPDGLDIVRRIIEQAPAFLKPGGMLALEIGIGQSGETIELMSAAGFESCKAEKDLSGIERVISGCLEKAR
ncbi:MAG: peptide chain release factor N(5)-glutamine methyltransferase [bacterium]